MIVVPPMHPVSLKASASTTSSGSPSHARCNHVQNRHDISDSSILARASDQQAAAADADVLSGAPAGVGAGQEHDDVGDVLGLAQSVRKQRRAAGLAEQTHAGTGQGMARTTAAIAR